MKKYILLIFIALSCLAQGQTPTPSGYQANAIKWKFLNPQWFNAGMYLSNLSKIPNQNRILVYDSVTQMIGYKFVPVAATPTLQSVLTAGSTGSISTNFSITSTGAATQTLEQAAGLYRFGKGSASGFYGTLDFASLSASRTFTFPNTAGTLALTSDIITYTGSDGVVKVGNDFRVDYTKANSVWSANGAASQPVITYSGTPFAGTGTTSTPLVLFKETATSAATIWNTAGTYLGINARSGFTGNLVHHLLNNASRFKVDYEGNITGNTGNSQVGTSAEYYYRMHASEYVIKNGGIGSLTETGNVAILNGSAGIIFNPGVQHKMHTNGNITLQGTTSISAFALPVSPISSANIATVSIGGNNWTGSGITLNSLGTTLALSELTGFAGEYVHFGKGTISHFKIGATGNMFTTGKVAIDVAGSTPAYDAQLWIRASDGTAGSGAIKIDDGILIGATEDGLVEFDESFYVTNEAGNRIAIGGKIAGWSAAVFNTGTSETDLYTYTTKANTLYAEESDIVFEVTGAFNDVTATGQVKFYYAGNLLFDSQAITITDAGAWIATCRVKRTSSTTATTSVIFSFPHMTSPTTKTAQIDLTGLDFTTTNIIKVTGQAGGASGGTNDVKTYFGELMLWPKASNP